MDASGGIVDRVFLHCLPQSLMERWVAHVAVTDPSWEHLRGHAPGTVESTLLTARP